MIKITMDSGKEFVYRSGDLNKFYEEINESTYLWIGNVALVIAHISHFKWERED